MKLVSNNNILRFLYQGCNIIYSVLMLSHHTSLFPLCLCVFPPSAVLSGWIDVVPYSCNHLQAGPAPTLPLSAGQIPGCTHIAHHITSLRPQIRTYFRNFQQNKIDTEEGAALHPVLDFKTSSSATGGSYWELKDWKLLGYNDEVTLDIGKLEKQ